MLVILESLEAMLMIFERLGLVLPDVFLFLASLVPAFLETVVLEAGKFLFFAFGLLSCTLLKWSRSGLGIK